MGMPLSEGHNCTLRFRKHAVSRMREVVLVKTPIGGDADNRRYTLTLPGRKLSLPAAMSVRASHTIPPVT